MFTNTGFWYDFMTFRLPFSFIKFRAGEFDLALGLVVDENVFLFVGF